MEVVLRGYVQFQERTSGKGKERIGGNNGREMLGWMEKIKRKGRMWVAFVILGSKRDIDF